MFHIILNRLFIKYSSYFLFSFNYCILIILFWLFVVSLLIIYISVNVTYYGVVLFHCSFNIFYTHSFYQISKHDYVVFKYILISVMYIYLFNVLFCSYFFYISFNLYHSCDSLFMLIFYFIISFLISKCCFDIYNIKYL